MLTKEHADMLRVIAHRYNEMFTSIASNIENTANIDAADDAKRQALQDIGKSAAESIAEMVAALECDYDLLEKLRGERAAYADEDSHKGIANTVAAKLGELEKTAGDCESREDAEQRISEDPLSIELTGTWTLGDTPVADRALILLGTGGPATRIVCELDEHMEPHRAWIEAQDWGTPWTEYRGDAISSDDLLTYCRCFYFGEG